MTDPSLARARAIVEAAGAIIPELAAILTGLSDSLLLMLAYLVTEATGESEAAAIRAKLQADPVLVDRLREGFIQLGELHATVAPATKANWLTQLRQVARHNDRPGLTRRDYYFGSAIALFVFLVCMFAGNRLDPGGGIGIALVPVITLLAGAIVDAVRHMAGLSITNPLTGAPVGGIGATATAQTTTTPRGK